MSFEFLGMKILVSLLCGSPSCIYLISTRSVLLWQNITDKIIHEQQNWLLRVLVLNVQDQIWCLMQEGSALLTESLPEGPSSYPWAHWWGLACLLLGVSALSYQFKLQLLLPSLLERTSIVWPLPLILQDKVLRSPVEGLGIWGATPLEGGDCLGSCICGRQGFQRKCGGVTHPCSWESPRAVSLSLLHSGNWE